MSLFTDIAAIRKDGDALVKGQAAALAGQKTAAATAAAILAEAQEQTALQTQQAASLADMAAALKALVDFFTKQDEPAGLQVEHGPPEPHSSVSPLPLTAKGVYPMPKVTLAKKSALKAAHGVKAGAASDFVLQDNEDGSVTVVVVDKAGNPVTDATALAGISLTAASADPAVVAVTVDPAVALTAKESAVGPLTTPGTPVVVTFTATWADGSFGPFSIDDPVDVVNSPAGGLVVVHGTPTVR